MSDELLPCPFCGSESVVYSVNFRNVRCNNCWCRTEPGDEDKATAEWNRRALSRDSEDADELLRECSELLALTAEAMCDDPSMHTPTCGRIVGAITRIDAFLNAARGRKP